MPEHITHSIAPVFDENSHSPASRDFTTGIRRTASSPRLPPHSVSPPQRALKRGALSCFGMGLQCGMC